MQTSSHLANDQAVALILAALAALAAAFIYCNSLAHSLFNEDRRSSGRIASAAIAVLSLAVIAFQADRLRFFLAAGSGSYVAIPARMFWAGIPLLAHGLVLIFRDQLQLVRLRKTARATWRPAFGDRLVSLLLAAGGAYLLWQWHPAYLSSAVGWTIALALVVVASVLLARWSAR